MSGRGCLVQQLKALDAYLFSMYSFSCGRFSSVGSQGRDGGEVGGGVLAGQGHGVSSLLTTPELEHFECDDTAAAITDGDSVFGVVQYPSSGKEEGMVPRSIQAPLER